MDNKMDFTKRLERVVAKPTVAVSRSTSVTPNGVKPVAKKKTNGQHSILYILGMFVVVTLVVFRSLSFVSDIDLEQRRASLVDGTSQEKQAAFVLSVVMVADPLVLPLLDKDRYAAATARIFALADKAGASLTALTKG
jgi:hypothetical protein